MQTGISVTRARASLSAVICAFALGACSDSSSQSPKQSPEKPEPAALKSNPGVPESTPSEKDADGYSFVVAPPAPLVVNGSEDGSDERINEVIASPTAVPSPVATATPAPAVEPEAPPTHLYVWRVGDLKSGSLEEIVTSLRRRSKFALGAADFRKSDTVELQGYHYVRYEQVKDGVAVEHAAIRVWISSASNVPVLVEAHVVDPTLLKKTESTTGTASLAADATLLAVAERKTAELAGDAPRLSTGIKDVWARGRLVRRVEQRTGKGSFRYDFDKAGGKRVVLRHRAPTHKDGADKAAPHASSDNLQNKATQPATTVNVFRLWEHAIADFSGDAKPEDRKQATEPLALKNILKGFRNVSAAASDEARTRVFKREEITPEVKAHFPAFWKAQDAYVANTGVDSGSKKARIRLLGRNAAVFVSPAGAKAFSPAGRSPFALAPHFELAYESSDDDAPTTFRFEQPVWGRGAHTLASFAMRRPEPNSTSLPSPSTPGSALDPVKLLAEGFDDLQVYTGIDTFMEVMRASGLGDPDISTRPFAAFLYDPSIEMRDNAFNDGDAIHFSTYSQVNMARDNTTIWHELGHGLQGRVMGPHIDAESYGLWEGMADFISSLVTTYEFGDEDFPARDELRIANRTWFNNTNEEHDEGEAYGGAMEDMLQAIMKKYGTREGQMRMADLTFETMRITRDHPALTPTVWFQHMLFADSLERAGSSQGTGKSYRRVPGELSPLVREALRARDYMPGKKPARSTLRYEGVAVNGTGDLGGRYNPVKLAFDSITAPKALPITIAFRNNDAGSAGFKFPLRVQVDFNVWALQGAVRWQENDEPLSYTVTKEYEPLTISLAVRPGCDAANRSDGGCSDYAYVRVWNAGDAEDARPIVKKRFYVRLAKE